MSGLAAIWCGARSRRRTRPATSLSRRTAAIHLNTNLLAAGDPLARCSAKPRAVSTFARKTRFGLVIDVITAQLGLIRTLRGLTPTSAPSTMRSSTSSGSSAISRVIRVWRCAECWYWIRKLQARFFAGDYAAAVEAVIEGATAALDIASQSSKRRNITSTARCRAGRVLRCGRGRRATASMSRRWPPTTEQLAGLGGELPGELSRTAPRWSARRSPASKAASSTPCASTNRPSARPAHNGFVHNEALANELAARFYAARGFEKIAHAYLRNARHCYLRWGADGKVRQLDRALSAPQDGRASARSDEHDRGAGRTPRPRDRDQSLASRVGRDRAGEADRHAHAHGDRARRRRARPADSAARRRAADRGGSHDQRRHRHRASARRARDRGRAAGVGPPLCRCARRRA